MATESGGPPIDPKSNDPANWMTVGVRPEGYGDDTWTGGGSWDSV